MSILKKIDTASLWTALKNADPWLFAAAVGLSALSWIMSAIRWQEVLRVMNAKVSWPILFSANITSIFYSMILPGGKVSGDAISAYRITRRFGAAGNKTAYVFSVIMDRIFGVLTFLIFLSLYFIFNEPTIYVLGGQKFVAGLMAIVGAIVGALIVFTNIFDRLLLVAQKIKINWLQKIIIPALEALSRYRARPSILLKILAVSSVSMILSASSIFFISRAVGLHQPLLTVVFAYLLSTIFVLIPLTVAGIGLREGSIVFVMTRAGANTEQAVALAFLAIGMFVLFAIWGGLGELYRVLKKSKKFDHGSTT